MCCLYLSFASALALPGGLGYGFVFSFGYPWMVDIVRIRAGRGMERSMGLYIKCNIRLFRFDSSHICSLLLRHLMRSIGENTCRHLSARPRSYYLETPSRFDGALPLRALGLMGISPLVSKGTSLRVRVFPVRSHRRETIRRNDRVFLRPKVVVRVQINHAEVFVKVISD